MQTDTNHIPLVFRRLRALAERNPRRVVRLLQRRLAQPPADNSLLHAWTVCALGWGLLYWERFNDARLHLRAARQVFEAGSHHHATLYCDYALLLADLLQRAWADEQALMAFATDFEQAGEVSEAIRVRLYQAILLDTLGRSHEAKSVLDRIAPALTADEPLDQARWWYVRGAVAITEGDYATAETLLTQTEQVFAATYYAIDRAKCWFQQAWAALRQEKLPLALKNYGRAREVFARLDLPVRLALCDKGTGLLLARMGRYDDALRALLNALRLFTPLGRARDIGECQLNLGNIYFYTGLWDIALAYYSRVTALYDTVGVVSLRVTVQRNRAMVYRIQGRLNEAHALLTEIEVQALGDQAELAEIWAEQAGLLAQLGRYEDAHLQYQRAHDLFEHQGSQLDAAECRVEQGWLALQHGNVEMACPCFETAAPLVAQQPYYRWRTDYGLARCAELRGDITTARQHYRTASDTVATLRRRLVSEVASSGLYRQTAQLHNDSLRLAVACGALDDALTLSEWQRALVLQRALVTPLSAPPPEYQDELQALQGQIDALLSADSAMDETQAQAIDTTLAHYGDVLLQARHHVAAPSGRASAIPEPAFDLAGLRAQMGAAYGADWTALVYIWADQTLLIGVVTPEKLELEKRPYDRVLQRGIERATQATYQLYTYRDLPFLQGTSTEAWEGLRALGNQLLPATVQARLHPQHRLLIVPAGPLHTLSWGALRLDDQWLAERTIIHLAPSLTVWQSLAARPATHNTRALLIGCSRFGTRAAALPAVADELTAIAAHWPGESARVVEAGATRTALQEQAASGELARYGLLHIASHAQLLPTRGLAAHLKLWDGDLWLSEIAGLNLGGPLVVLSACDGAIAETLPGDEVLSLSWAFLAAGASAVLASLWQVNDQAVRQFMMLFYAALRQHGDVGLALAQAQRGLIDHHRQASDQSAEPMAWASFVLIGGGQGLW